MDLGAAWFTAIEVDQRLFIELRGIGFVIDRIRQWLAAQPEDQAGDYSEAVHVVDDSCISNYESSRLPATRSLVLVI